jgi:hypothetical protein
MTLLFDMTDDEYEKVVKPYIRKKLKDIQDYYSYEKLMTVKRHLVFVVGPYFGDTDNLTPRGGMEHGIFFSNENGELTLRIDFELYGHFYTMGMHKEFCDKIERFKKIGRKIFLDEKANFKPLKEGEHI